jgi:hypothetical protein
MVNAVGVGTLLYVLAFFVLWLGGGYTLNRSGRTRSLNLADVDVFDWQPLFGNCQPEYQWPGGERGNWRGGRIAPRCDLIGWAYYPLWLLLKKRHPTYRFLESDRIPYQAIKPDALPRGFDLHPRHRKDLEEVLTRMRSPNNASTHRHQPSS